MRSEDRQLHIGRLLADAYGLVFGQFAGLLRLALVPALLMFGILVSMFVLSDLAAAAAMSEAVVGGLTVIGFLLALVVMVPFAAGWYRVSLLGPAPERLAVGFAFGHREWRFFGFFLTIAMIGALVVFVPMGLIRVAGFGALSTPLSALAVFFLIWVMLYLVARLAFVLPAAAAGIDTSFRAAWRQSAGNGMRLAAAIFVAELPWRVADTIVDTVAGGQALFFYVPATAAISVISLAVLAATLSLAYREQVVGENDAPEPFDRRARSAYT